MIDSNFSKFPALFISDFGPMPAVEESDYTRALTALGERLPRPKALVVMSGHWETHDLIKATGAKRPVTIYDYTGFPKHYYGVRYDCPGDPAVAREVVGQLGDAGVLAALDESRGLDHGAWVPLSRLYPKADVPVVQLSSPLRGEPSLYFKMGQALKPLREQGVMIVAAGALIHNLRLIHFGGRDDAPDAWAVEFERWLLKAIVAGDRDALFDYLRKGPQAERAAPTPEHFNPLFWMLGACDGESIRIAYQQIQYGNGLLAILESGSPA